MARQLDRDERDRLCSLFDDGDEWRFDALRMKYTQYSDHTLEDRPVIRIVPSRILSWGQLTRPPDLC